MDAVKAQIRTNQAIIFIGLEIALILIVTTLGYNVFSNIIGILVIAGVFADVSGNVKLFFRDWSLYLLGLSIFNLLRGTVYNLILLLHIPVRALYVIKLEHFLTSGYILPHVLQIDWNLFQPMQWINIQFTLLYIVHFFIFFALGLIIWKTRHAEFNKYKAAFLLTLFIMVVCYFFIPSIPPWMASQRHLIPTVLPLTEMVMNHFLPSLFTAFNGDPIACMPSIHAAFAMLCALICVHHFRWKGGLLFIYTVWLDIACMALGAHYWVDILMGNLLAILVYIFIYHTSPFIHFSQLFSHKRNSWIAVALGFNILLAVGNMVLANHVTGITFSIH